MKIKNKSLIIAVVINLILLGLLFYPLHTFPEFLPQGFDETKILLKYEIFGCGSLIRTVEKGGQELFETAGLETPESGIYEVRFTDGSDEPVKHLNSAEFFTAGLARGCTYVVYGKTVDTTNGAPDCCEPTPAYNETVPLFKVEKWKPTRFMWEFNENIIVLLLLMLCTPITVIIALVTVIKHFRLKGVDWETCGR